jgi:hypothetical protein
MGGSFDRFDIESRPIVAPINAGGHVDLLCHASPHKGEGADLPRNRIVNREGGGYRRCCRRSRHRVGVCQAAGSCPRCPASARAPNARCDHPRRQTIGASDCLNVQRRPRDRRKPQHRLAPRGKLDIYCGEQLGIEQSAVGAAAGATSLDRYVNAVPKGEVKKMTQCSKPLPNQAPGLAFSWSLRGGRRTYPAAG